MRGNAVRGNAGGQIQVQGSSSNLFEDNEFAGALASPAAASHGETGIRHGRIQLTDSA